MSREFCFLFYWKRCCCAVYLAHRNFCDWRRDKMTFQQNLHVYVFNKVDEPSFYFARCRYDYEMLVINPVKCAVGGLTLQWCLNEDWVVFIPGNITQSVQSAAWSNQLYAIELGDMYFQNWIKVNKKKLYRIFISLFLMMEIFPFLIMALGKELKFLQWN